jgi:cystathionine beta-lyase
MDERTRLIRDATARPADRRPVNPPVARGTTILMSEAAALRDSSKGVLYGIDGLDSQNALAAALSELEGATRTLLVPTGLAAVTVGILSVVQTGDEILVTDALYRPSRRFCDRFLKRMGVSTRYMPPRASAEEVLAAITERTRLIVMESPGSLTFEIQDVPGIARLARERGVRTLVDNTYAAGLLFKPLAHGVDLSVQALSKYVGGHSDVFLGSISVADAKLGQAVQDLIFDMGWYVSPDDAWLALRGLRTLPVRMKAHEAGALEVARWLAEQPEVVRVLHPAFEDFPDNALWRRDFSGSNGLFSIVLRSGSREDAFAFLDALELFGLGFSWGGFDSLATYEDPQLPTRDRPPVFEGPLIRLHVGLEAPADLIADLRRALDVYAARMA